MQTYIPSPVNFEYDSIFKAVANKSGRMQYYRLKKGKKRERISKGEFSDVFNHANIIAIRPIQNHTNFGLIQMDIFVK